MKWVIVYVITVAKIKTYRAARRALAAIFTVIHAPAAMNIARSAIRS